MVLGLLGLHNPNVVAIATLTMTTQVNPIDAQRLQGPCSLCGWSLSKDTVHL
jgi:hypothetical protein